MSVCCAGITSARALGAPGSSSVTSPCPPIRSPDLVGTYPREVGSMLAATIPRRPTLIKLNRHPLCRFFITLVVPISLQFSPPWLQTYQNSLTCDFGNPPNTRQTQTRLVLPHCTKTKVSYLETNNTVECTILALRLGGGFSIGGILRFSSARCSLLLDSRFGAM